MNEMKAFAREKGYVETRFGRKVHIQAIRDKNPAMRSFGERAAINAPIQGTAADIIKRAMVRLRPALEKAGSPARMLLQVHDELVFEVRSEEHTSELQSLMRISYAVFCLKKKKNKKSNQYARL